MLNIVAVLLALTAAFAYINHKFLKWPMTIGVMTIALGMSLAVIGLDWMGFATLRGKEHALLASIDFAEVLMQGMLSFLLFAGALHVDLGQLRRMAWQVGALALVGTALSTLIVGYGAWYLLQALGIALPLTYCLLFGAVISPTDPIAVLGVLKSAKVPQSVEATIAGESLINDGVGVVLFTLVLEMLRTGAAPTFEVALAVFAREALGGATFGVAVGYGVYRVLRTIDAPLIEILITIATVVAGYALACAIHVSGPLAMVAIGLLIGNEGRALAMSPQTRERLDMFWQLIDEILNGVLFVLIGLEFALIDFPPGSMLAAVLVVALCLLARYLTVGLPVRAGRKWFGLPAGSEALLTWSGIRGGISVALALSLPVGDERNLILMLTYCVVVFSILVQGLTVGRLARRLGLGAPS
ncbi:MAG TPA: sodium:proton antiporter [Casimicrobiaceae bacterium]|nr:sodium:proton antiporter [Casimicrobiaceae bacterium]